MKKIQEEVNEVPQTYIAIYSESLLLPHRLFPKMLPLKWIAA